LTSVKGGPRSRRDLARLQVVLEPRSRFDRLGEGTPRLCSLCKGNK